MSRTIQYSPPNQIEHGILLTFSVDTVGGDGIVGYMFYTKHSSSQIGGGRGDSTIKGSSTEDINHYSLFNVGKIIDGIGRSGYISWTIPSTSHHSGDHGISSDFYSYGDNRSGNRSHNSQFSEYNHIVINISHAWFPL